MTGEDAPSRPSRMPLSRVVELLLARGGGERSSVTLTRNAKGVTQIDVVVRTTDGPDDATAELAAERAKVIYDDLCARYPLLTADAS